MVFSSLSLGLKELGLPDWVGVAKEMEISTTLSPASLLHRSGVISANKFNSSSSKQSRRMHGRLAMICDAWKVSGDGMVFLV